MALGPGEYDKEATIIRVTTRARAVIVGVIGGERGNGFSVQADPQTTMQLPKLLRMMADQIEKDGPFG